MTPRKKADWRRVVLYAAVGAVSVLVLIVVAGAGMVMWASSVAKELGAPTLVEVARTVPVAAPPLASPAAADGAGTSHLKIELRDGRFEVVPGPEGSEIQITGEYAENYYELLEEHGPGGVSIRLRPRTSGLVRLLGTLQGEWEAFEDQNEMTVAIPTDRPLALDLAVSRGDSRIELGGLTLTELDVEMSMGNHHLAFSEPVAQPVERVVIGARYGNIEVEDLGNARAGEVYGESRTGNVLLDLGGQWRRGKVVDVILEHSIGQLALRVPTTLRISHDSQNLVWVGEASDLGRENETHGGDEPAVRLLLSTSLGETHIRRYRD